MLVQNLIKVGIKLKPLRYFVEEMTYRAADDTRALASWRNRYQGKPMLVVGNGPSLNETPLDEFTHVASLGMNKIDLLFTRSAWRPNAIFCVNDMVVRQHYEQWLGLDIPTFLSWKSRWHVPSAERHKFNYFLSRNSREFSQNAEQGLGSGFTVTYACLQFAYFCGADPVIIFGVDHSFQQADRPGAYEKQSGPDKNHFDPNYFQSGTLWGLANLAENENDYRRALDGFQRAGRRVLDATVGGKLTVFPKIGLDEARALVRG